MKIRQKIRELRKLKLEYLHNYENIKACSIANCQDGAEAIQDKNIKIVREIKAIFRECQLTQNRDYPDRLFEDNLVFSYIFKK